MHIDLAKGTMTIKGKKYGREDVISIDGGTGEVMSGAVGTIEPKMSGDFGQVMKWSDKYRTIGVRTNADTPADALRARDFGAEGIGLCRTEHMFFEGDRIRAMREMILSETQEARIKALDKLLPYQREDFIGIFKAMKGQPVTIRLIDPPLHEFVPHEEEQQAELAKIMGMPVAKVRARVKQLHEANPMLGHRGCRLCVTYPEILDMQVRAIVEATIDCLRSNIKVFPEIMIPLVGTKKELVALRAQCEAVIAKVKETEDYKPRLDIKIGTMIEVPRAAVTADEIAEAADFFSFGTNDLTQMTFGFSRDDIGTFLGDYLAQELLPADPFQTLDVGGVGRLVELGITQGRQTKPDLKIGICGEHGGDPKSVEFCHKVGMDYVSCSPFRIPIARLAAAQAAIRAEK
jgi:pyruvate,orthophosphate dikinase